MTVNINAVSIFAGGTITPTAPLIEGAAAAGLILSREGGSGFDLNSAVPAGRYGCRLTLPSAADFSTHDYISFGVGFQQTPLTNVDTVANGGYRLIFVDGSGNYAGYNITGSGIPDSSSLGEGFPQSFVNNNQDGTNNWVIDRGAPPAISGGTINWANITALEINVATTSAIRKDAYLRVLAKRNEISITGTETFFSINTAAWGVASNIVDRNLFARNRYYFNGPSQSAYTSRIGINVGNGSTTTNLTESSFSLGFQNTYDKSPAFRSLGPVIQLDTNYTRAFNINQSATDVLSLTDGSIASAGWWQWVLAGSGSATCTRVQFWRYNGFTCAHGTYTDCQWNGGDASITYSTASTITRGIVRDATAGGLTITSGPGVFSALDVDFQNNTTFDVAMGSGGAGTYELINVGVIGAYTLKIHNNSATNAITVAIPSGIAYSTTTAGGSITVSTPAVYQSVTVNGLISGSRLQIYDTTNSIELANVTTGTSYTWTDASPAAADRDIRVRIAYVSGTTAKQFLEAEIGTCGISTLTAAVVYLANQVDDTVYNANAIDGSTVTGITISDGIDRMIINIAGGSVSWAQIYAYNVYWLSTSAGIVDDGAIITAVDTANYRVAGFKIRNSSTVPLSITGGYGVDSVTNSVAALIDTAGSTGNIYQTPDHVVAYATGSGLSPAENAQLFSLNTNAVNLVSIKGQTINGTGSDVDPWGP